MDLRGRCPLIRGDWVLTIVPTKTGVLSIHPLQNVNVLCFAAYTIPSRASELT